MTEYDGQAGAGGSSWSDETLRLYLLCRLGEDERLRLDQRLMIDDGLAAALLLAESELTDDYASGNLDSIERKCFETSFLTTESRRQRLRFTSALHTYAGAQASSNQGSRLTQKVKSSWHEGLTTWLSFGPNRGWAVAGSFALLIMLVGLGWFIARQRYDREPLITRNEPIPTSPPQASPRAVASPAASIQPQPQTPPERKPPVVPTPAQPSAPTTVASFVLLPGALRDGGDMQRVAVPNGESDIVRFSLVLETDSEGVYQAELATAEGQKVMVRRKLRAVSQAGDPKLTIDIPARLLHNGDYQIKLTRQKDDGQSAPAGRYTFRALK